MKVSRRQINKAKLAYRAHHAKLKEYDYGYTHFEEFIGLNQMQAMEYHYSNNSTYIDVTELTVAKIRALDASPEYIYIMLKAATAKYGKSPLDVTNEEDGTVIWNSTTGN